MIDFKQTIWLLIFVGCVFSTAACAVPPVLVLQPTPTAMPTEAIAAVMPAETVEPPTAVPSETPTSVPTTLPTPTAEPARDTIVIPIAIYILDDADGKLSSGRTIEDIELIFERVNEIWSQADIELDIINIGRVEVPQELLLSINQRDFFSFFGAVNRREVDLPQFAPIVAFYSQTLGGPNGIAPSNSNTFFVMDTPSVFDERVTSHEIGHILGLHHVLNDRGRLLFSGTNGMALTEEEVAVARYSAKGLLDGLR